MSVSLRSTRVRAVALALTAALLLFVGIVPALARPVGGGAPGIRDWLSRAVRALAQRERAMVMMPGDTTVIYGPLRVTSPSGSQTLGVERFTPSVSAGRQYLLELVRGDGSGGALPATVAARLNGSPIASEADFAGGVNRLTRVVALTATDTVTLAVSGSAGATAQVRVLEIADPTVLVYGPQEFLRGTGQPETETVHFNFDGRGGAPFRLALVNGLADGTKRTSSATIVVNGQTIVTQGDLNQQVGSLTRSVPLVVGDNVMQVTVSSVPSSRVTLSITAADVTAPVLAIASPTAGQVTGDTTFAASGTVTDQTATRVTVNGAETVRNGDAWSAALRLGAEGANTVTVRAVDAAGNATDSVRTVIRDTQAPVVTLDGLPDTPIYRAGATLTVTGTITDRTAVTANVNGQALVIDSVTHRFTATVQLASGANFVTVAATDAAARTTTVVRQVTRDDTPPAVTLTSPATEGGVTRTAALVVTGTASDQSGARVIVNDVAATLDAAGAFSVPLTLGEGANTITVLATDAAGNPTTVIRHIDLDTQAPALDVAAPQDGALPQAGNVGVSGTVTDAHAVTVTANGTALTVASGGAFSGSIAAPADRVVTVIATDAAGNATTVTRTLGQETAGGGLPPDPATVAPALDYTSPSTSIATATAFLYTGAHPIQTGVAAGTIVAQRAAVVRGGVRTRAGNALPGVRVSVLDHPEFGQTLSRADGMYDLAVNGGGQLTLQFEKAGSLPAQRQVQVPWQDYAIIDDAVLVPVDSVVTPITLGGSTTQVAHGSMSTDERGSRQATMVFAPGTTASLVMPDGSTTPVSTINVRATEYTVGPSGPSAMPAVLPPTSAYTYAVELSADEAIAAGASGVRFNQDVPVYVDNFLGVRAGTAVPVGFYDRQRGAWVPQANGIVIAILGVTDGTATIDVDGDGAADPASTLAFFGISDAERGRLAELYAPGKTLTRVATRHFSSFDFNYPPALPSSMIPPPKQPRPKKRKDHGKCKTGSIIDCENQALGEVLWLGGTPYSLRYRSDRMPGYTDGRALTIPLSDGVSPSLKRIEVRISVAGRVFRDTLAPAPNLKYDFQWDGRDAYGRELSGDWPVTATVTHVYPVTYVWPRWTCVNGQLTVAPSLFGLTVGQECQWAEEGSSSDLLKTDMAVTSEFNTTLTTFPALGGPASRLSSVGGWTLGVLHGYDPTTRTLYRGDGLQRSAEQLARVTITAAGTGEEGHSGDGGPATSAQLTAPGPLAVDADGTVYVAQGGGTNIRRIAPNGTITLFAGGYGSASVVTTQADAGDGGPATSAKFKSIQDLAIGPDGSVYVADNAAVRRIGPDGIITTAAGAYGRPATTASGDGAPATAATFANIWGVDVGADGSVYIADGSFTRPGVRKVSPDGILTTLAGGRGYVAAGACNVDGIAATAACLNSVQQVRVAGDGSVYLLESSRIRRITPDGLIRLVAGNPVPAAGGYLDSLPVGLPAIGPGRRVAGYYMDVAPDGAIYTNDYNRSLVLRIGADGIVTTLAGNGKLRSGYDDNLQVREGASATSEPIYQYAGIAAAPDGSIYLSDATTLRVHHISAPLPGLGASEFFVASDNGMEQYVFSGSGKHLRTLSTLTGKPMESFGYGADGQLTSVTDQFGLVTRIGRDGPGNVTAVTGPYGQQTRLNVGADGLLASVINAVGDTTTLAYGPGGLLASIREPATANHTFTYTPGGRLLRDQEPGGDFQELSRFGNDSSSISTVTDVLGRTTRYTTVDLSAGGARSETVGPDGLVTVTLTRPDAVKTTTDPTGMVTEVVAGPDPRFGMQAPLDSRVTTSLPSGLASTTTATQTAVLDDPRNPATLRFLIDSIQVNGNLFTRTIDWTQRNVTQLTPEGRVTTSVFDTLGRVVDFRSPGLSAVKMAFDSAGRLATTTQAGRTVRYVYGADGNLERSIDPMGQTRVYSYDSVGRVRTFLAPGGGLTRYTYDGAGRRKSVTMPGGQRYDYSYDSAGRFQSYTAPAVDGRVAMGRYEYDVAGRQKSFIMPDSSIVRFGYDSTGHRTTVTHADGQVKVEYYGTSGLPKRLSSNGNTDAITLGYDGPLVTSAQVTGLVTGTVGFGYDADLRLSSQTVNGGTIFVHHDRDGLLDQAGALTLQRAPESGALIGTTLLGVTTRATADSLGMSVADSTWLGGSLRFAYELTRDSLQRITAKREVVNGVAVAFGYAYDSVGRLAVVRRDGAPVAVYDYDANGNRVHLTTSTGTLTATYDARDRLITYGDAQYTFGESGRLMARVVGTERTEYHYDALGNLLLVTLPDGRRIEYVVDAMSRRIAKKVNGVVVQRFLYGDGGHPVAEVDAAGTVTTRYVYGARDNVPAYMERGGVTYRLLTDQLGSVRLVVDASSGVVAQRIDYDEFGRVVADSNAGFQPFGYAGGLYDADTRLVRFGARDYDAETGRWTAEDPIGIQRGDENLYAYVHNAPLNGIDPTGLKVQCTYVQSSGMLTCTDEDHNTYYEKGYSGSTKEGGKNKPDMDGKPNVGPIPRGTYTIEECYLGGKPEKYGPDANRKNKYTNEEGQPTLSLTPDDGNDMHGRAGFLMHSDPTKYQNASAGCIIMSDQFRHWIQDNGGGELTVVR